MKVVRLLDDDFSNVTPQWAINALAVGEEFPVKGGVYIVTSEAYNLCSKDVNVEGYELEDFPFTNYLEDGERAYFNAKRFEVVKQEFVPTDVLEDGTLYEKKQITIKLDFDLSTFQVNILNSNEEV